MMKGIVLPIQRLCNLRALYRPFSIQCWALALRGRGIAEIIHS